MANTNNEFIGYKLLSKYALRAHRFFNKISQYFLSRSKEFQFEQFKMKFGERDDDIYISTYPKSGTTVMQVIVYQLTTDGAMDFDHIYDVSPWIRNASFLKKEPPNLPSPRIIKTHDKYGKFSKNTKGKIIYVHRNGMDVAVSHYHQEKNYNFPNLTFENYLKGFFKSKRWFKHTKKWLQNSKKLPILYVRYEDLLHNKREVIEQIINFLNLNVTDDAIERALHYSSFEYMKEHEHLFGDRPPEKKEKVYDQFIREGKSGSGKTQFNKEQKELFQKDYDKFVKTIEQKTFKHSI